MALAVVKVDHDGTRGYVTIQSNLEGAAAIEDLRRAEARNMAIKAAAEKGLPDPRTELTLAPYAVDEQGATITNPKDQKVAAYRVDVPVVRRLV